ncbi:uncharacterized protein V1516DRAFT_664147 [Lipomyces oligophaga]|uniref:uncharacterized protein n=1 Tax=Lipomyces oligophaga TaxID=45792 RepID=UPI0034CDA102
MHRLSTANLSAILLFLSVLILEVAAVASDAPACYQPCIDNTKIISGCDRYDTECFCKDESYQLALYGCLYSQCTPKELPFAQNLANSNCLRFNIQPGANPHLAKRFDPAQRNYQRAGFSSSGYLSRSSSRFSSGAGYSVSTASSSAPVSSLAYTDPPAEAKHIVKRMADVGMNQCGQSCFYSKLITAGCSPTDLACICSSAYFNAVTDCLVDSCYDQIPLAFQVRPTLCS